MNMADDWEDSVANQLEHLESRVFGDVDASKVHIKCIESVAAYNSRLNSAITGRDRISSVLNKLEDVEKYLDPQYAEELALPENAKFQLILAEEKKIKRMVEQLEKIEELKDVLNSEHIKNTPAMTDRLLKLSEIQLEQQDVLNATSEEVKNLISSYNSIINTLTKQFVQWDEIVTRLEVASQPKKRLD